MIPTSAERSEITNLASFEQLLVYAAAKLQSYGTSRPTYPALEVDASGVKAPCVTLKGGITEYGPNQGTPLAWGSFVLPVSDVHSSKLWLNTEEAFTETSTDYPPTSTSSSGT